MNYFFSSAVVPMVLAAACSTDVDPVAQGPIGTGATGETGGAPSAGSASGRGGTAGSAGAVVTGGASGSAGAVVTGGAPGSQCTTNAQCPQLGCYMCSSACVNGRCVTYVPSGTGGAIGAGGSAAGGVGNGGAGAGGRGVTGGSAGAGTGGGGPATCPDHVPRLPQYPYTPEHCTFGDMSLTCPYPTPEVGAGCRTTFVCRCLSNHMGGADCNWTGSGSVCPDGGP